MTVLSVDTIADLGYRAGWRGETLVTATAVALAESGGKTDAVGDVTLQTSIWGPSIGLWQIRSLVAQYGTGGQRDEVANRDPATNARHAYEISGGGATFRPWSTYTNGDYRSHLAAARTAAANAAGRGGGPAGVAITGTTTDTSTGATLTLPPVEVPYNAGGNLLEVTSTPLTVADLVLMPMQGGAIGGLLERILTATLDLSLEEEDQLTITIADPGLVAFTTSRVMPGLFVDLGELVMLVTAVEVGQGGAGEHVIVTARDAAAEFAKRNRAPGPTRNASPSELFRGAIGAYGGDKYSPTPIVEPSPAVDVHKDVDEADPRKRLETTWAQYSKYADDLGFVFSVGHGFAIFARATFVAATLPGVVVRYRPGTPLSPTEPDYAFAPVECPTCRRVDESTNSADETSGWTIPRSGFDAPADITVRLPAGRASRIRPGMRLELYGMASFDASYIIYNVSGDLASTEPWTVRARTPLDPIPKAPAAPATTGTPATAGSAAVGTKEASDFVAFAQSMAGHAYVYGAEVSLTDPTPGAFDCSELVQWAAARAGVTFPDGSSNQYAACQKAGTLITEDVAAWTRGALLFRGKGGSEHVVISLGDGSRTIEARGKAYGVVNATIAGRGWSAAALIPGLHYQRTPNRALLRPGVA